MKDTQTVEGNYKTNMKEKIGRQLDILDDQLDRDEKAKLMNDPDV